jgi:hypothetical protein
MYDRVHILYPGGILVRSAEPRHDATLLVNSELTKGSVDELASRLAYCDEALERMWKAAPP